MGRRQSSRSEIDLVYAASSRLIRAATPLEQLEAISEHARSQGASKGALFYFEYEDRDRTDVVAAEWIVGNAIPYGTGTRFRLPRMGHRFTSPQGKPILISDTRTDERLSATIREIDLKHGIYACAILLLHNRGQRVAGILFGWQEPRQFDNHDEKIYTMLQQLAAPVVDSVRLLEQTQRRAAELEQANQEIELLYRTSEVINAANTFEEVVEAIARFDPEAEVVTLMLWNTLDWETADYLEVLVVIDRTGTSKLQPGTRFAKAMFPIAQQMLGERAWLFEDGHTDPRVDPITAEAWQQLDIRSFMGPALYIQERWLGGITFHSSRPRKYSEREANLFNGIGDLVVAAVQRIRLQQETQVSRKHAEALALNNAELLEQARQRTAELEAANAEIDLLYRIGEAINSANSYGELVSAVRGVISGVDAVVLYLWEGWDFEAATCLEQVAATGDMLAHVGERIPKEALPYVSGLQPNRVVIVEDALTDSRLDATSVSSYVARGIRAAMSIRLYVNDRWIGALVFQGSRPRSFSEYEQRRALRVGDYVLGAVERIRLREETEAARRRAETLAEQAHQLAVLEERNRLARELHDSVSQALYGIVLGAQTARTFLDRDPQQAVEPLDYVLSLSEAGLAEMRALIFELRPETLEKEGLVEALSKQVTVLQARHGLVVKTAFDAEPAISIQHKEAVYWIAREALHNIIKHANASTVELCLKCTPEALRLSIADDGTGFDLGSDFSGHLGLQSMSERAARIGGDLQLTSQLHKGTQLHFHLPLDQITLARQDFILREEVLIDIHT
jgi:signal transduction histidine kinase